MRQVDVVAAEAVLGDDGGDLGGELRGACVGSRFLTQRSEDPCGSKSIRTGFCWREAKYPARLIAMVVLPEPPLGFRTTMRFMMTLFVRY